MKERLLELLKAENLSPSVFADEIGVQRSNVSHILSGRNKPGFDFIQKILTRFNNLNANWLINGDGGMYSDSASNDLFSPMDESVSDKNELNKEKIIKKDEKLETTAMKNEKTYDNKSIEKIIVFFSDGSFREYQTK